MTESSSMSNSTGYGSSIGRWSNLQFTGDERKYEQWEVKFLGYMKLKKLKSTINPDNPTAAEEEKNEEAFAELIQFLDDRSLSLVMRDAKDKGREALKILRDHYRSKGKQRIICLYTELTSLVKRNSESVIDYLIRAENASTSLTEAGEQVSDGLLVAMVLKGLPSHFKSFVTVITQSEKKWTFKDLKTSIRDYDDTEKARDYEKGASIMKTKSKSASVSTKITCYSCGVPGHKSNECRNKQKGKWCKLCKNSSHTDKTCRKQGNFNHYNNNEKVKPIKDEEVSEFHTFSFKIGEVNLSKNDKLYSFLVDSGCTSHIVVDDSSFINIDDKFVPSQHFIELADGRKYNNIALKRGSVKITLTDTLGETYDSILENCLYIPSYPENIFSIKAATSKGSSVNFYPNYAELVTANGTVFEIQCKGKLYYLQDVTFVKRSCDLEKWHKILGHCNKNDILKLENIVDGMKINSKQDFLCEPCILGKQTESISKKPAIRAKYPLEFVSSDLCGPIDPVSPDGFKYAISFIDNYSGYIFVYFIKQKSDATNCLLKFLADISPLGKVNCLLDISSDLTVKKLRSDGGGEYMGNNFKQVLLKNGIKHEQSAPYSPHQNGIAERGWRTLFEMGRCLLIGSGLQQILWPYAVMAAAYIRNRCYQQRTGETPYFLLTDRKPDISNMHVFGSICYSYVQNKTKLEPRSKRGIFVGYDKESPAFLIYYPELKKVMRCRSVKFTESLNTNEQLINTDDDFPGNVSSDIPIAEIEQEIVNIPLIIVDDVVTDASSEQVINVPNADSNEISSRVFPKRTRNPPKHLDDYVLDTDNDDIYITVDFCKRVNSDIPNSYKEAMNSSESENWQLAMDDEMKSLHDNQTFEIVPLPKNKKVVGGRWVFALKEGPNDKEIFKARYVAKGFTQVYGSDYFETYSPTAKITSIRILMQISVQYDLIVHQMDVKTAYLNAPIDCEIYVKQPEGYEITNHPKETLVYKLNKSLYGLKQSGRNWNNLLHKFFMNNNFIQSSADPCVYFTKSELDYIIALIWVDDIVLATNSTDCLSKIKTLLKDTFMMKDLGPISRFLGMKFVQTDDSIEINQTHYLNKILLKFGMEQCKPRSTPCEVNPTAFNSDESNEPQNNYREIIGSLIYAMVCTRPDLCWVVTKLSQHLDKPNKADWVMVKHVLRYLKGTVNYKLVYKKSENGLCLSGFSDSDWAGSVIDRRSTTGYYFSLNPNGPPVSWKSKKQCTVALSSCEAEYMALSASAQEANYLTMLMKDFMPMDLQFDKPVVIKADNQGAIALVKNNIIQNRSKHIDIRYHFIRNNYANGSIDIIYIPTESNVADLMTKPVTKQKLEHFKTLLFGV